VMEKLGPVATEFEVADIKLSRPGENEDFKMVNGMISAKAISLRDLISFAYYVDDDNDMLKGGEKWLETEKFDIVAKTAPTASPDTLRAMLQKLLIERFALKVHKDKQPVTVYGLTALKPKLKEADPDTRSTCNLSLENGSRTYICQNTTMAQFAAKIRDVAGASPYFDHPVVDLTGLKGSYDFSLAWAPRNRVFGRGGPQGAGGEAGATPTATDPNGALSIFEATDRQLGLKFVVQKVPMPVVVIDHVERKPTAN